MTIKGAVFDLDGMLLDTEGLQLEGWMEVLRPFGVFLTKHDYLEYAGETAETIEAEIAKKFNLRIKQGQLVEEKRKLLMKWLEDRHIYLMPYARESIGFFTGRKLKIAVASGGSKSEVLAKLKKSNLYQVFETIVSRDDVSRGKPHPEMYLLTARKLGLKPEECIAFEDTESGVQSAKAAGLVCLAVPNELSQNQNFSKADGIFSNLDKALQFVKKKYGL
jgi:HAD superfamily hydrolase (TIGR01509 family)